MVEDFDNPGTLRRLVEGNRDGGVITQIIGYLNALLDMFQAIPSTSITMRVR